MTIDEAIRILDPETTAEALVEYEYYGGLNGKTAMVNAVNDACDVAVTALRAKRDAGECHACQSLFLQKGTAKTRFPFLIPPIP